MLRRQAYVEGGIAVRGDLRRQGFLSTQILAHRLLIALMSVMHEEEEINAVGIRAPDFPMEHGNVLSEVQRAVLSQILSAGVVDPISGVSRRPARRTVRPH
jgi:hypothetical protein